jgi:hypothetical protein
VSPAIPSPIPPDPHEPVVGGVQPATAPGDRVAALNLIERARQNGLTHNRNMPPLHFTAQFTARGNAAGFPADNAGPGELTEIWMNGQKWRWTANLGSSCVVRISNQGQLLENTTVPMRAHMLRNEIFWAIEGYAANAQLRTAQVQWNGKLTTCILASSIADGAAQTQGRRWQEEEFCIDNNSGLLVLHSIAPGTFAVFGYDSNQQFHGRTMPDRINLYVNGSTVADTSFNITDTGPQDEASLTPGTEMTSNPRPIQTQMPA